MAKTSRHPEKLLLQHVLEFGGRLANSIGNLSEKAFLANSDLTDASLYRAQVIGEAMNGLPPAFRKKQSQIKWDKWIGVRHQLVHGYEAVDLSLIWKLATTELPKLLDAVRKIVATMK